MKYRISCNNFVVRSVEFPEFFRITPCFFLGGSSNVVDVTHTGVIWGCSWFFLIQSLHCLYCFDGTQNFELQSDREWVENESVDKDYPQKVTLAIHYCNHQYPLRTSSQNIVFVSGELWIASMNRYVFAPYQFHNTFLGIPESVRGRYVEHIRSDSEFNVCKFPCNSDSGDDVDHSLCCGGW